MGRCVFKSLRAGVKEDERSVAGFRKYLTKEKLQYSPQEWSIGLLFFVARLMAWDGGVWGIAFLIHRGQDDRKWQVSVKFQ